jgi:tRNA (cytidine/uridine-2'-O-)-methyltransferase
MNLHIVLVEPEIPQNTGNIARTCAALGAALHLVHPLGFSTSDRYLKRAGLDYWSLLEIHHHDNLEAFLELAAGRELYLSSKKAALRYDRITYPEDCCLLFGKETKGLPEELLQKYPDRTVRIPMIPGARSLNLSNSVAVIGYEVFRQHNFPGLLEKADNGAGGTS